MGARPLWAVLALGLPKKIGTDWLDALASGVKEAAAEHGVAVVGGDLSASDKIFVAVTAMGHAPERPLTRGAAEPGDALFVSGTLGAAAAGLRLLEKGFRVSAERVALDPKGRRVPAPRAQEVARLIRHQIDPRPQLELGATLAAGSLASAAIDVSDGLARDLYRVPRVRRRGDGRIRASPVDSAPRRARASRARLPRGGALRRRGLRSALHGPAEEARRGRTPRGGRFALRRIGTIDDGAGVNSCATGGGRHSPTPGSTTLTAKGSFRPVPAHAREGLASRDRRGLLRDRRRDLVHALFRAALDHRARARRRPEAHQGRRAARDARREPAHAPRRRGGRAPDQPVPPFTRGARRSRTCRGTRCSGAPSGRPPARPYGPSARRSRSACSRCPSSPGR